MKDKIKIFGIEDEQTDQELIINLIGEEDCTFEWAADDSLAAMEKQDYDFVLKEVQKAQPDCLIVDLGLTTKNRQLIEEEKGKEFPYAERTIEELGGGFVLVNEILLNKKLLPRKHICIFTNHTTGDAQILTMLSKRFFGYEIPIFQKGDKESEFKLREFVYKTKGILLKYVYTLIDQSNDKTREHIIEDLKGVSEPLKIRWVILPRMSLRNAEEYWAEDKHSPFDLAFFDLSLVPSDLETFEQIKDEYAPRLSLDSFSPLRFAKEFKENRKNCAVIFISAIEKRSLVIFLLSPELDGDWVIQKTTLSTSLVALLVKLFINK